MSHEFPGADYDAWKCTPPDGPEPEPEDACEACERELDALNHEVALLHAQIEDLEIQLAAEREPRP